MANIMAVRWMRLWRGTDSEHALEPAIAALGIPYRHQFPGFLFGSRTFPDFVIPALGLVIEVDDPSHEKADKVIADAERTEELSTRFGWRVVRCKNEEALNDPSGTVQRLLSEAGISDQDLRTARGRPIRLPSAQKAPKKGRRAARHAATVAKRRGSSGRRSGVRPAQAE